MMLQPPLPGVREAPMTATLRGSKKGFRASTVYGMGSVYTFPCSKSSLFPGRRGVVGEGVLLGHEGQEPRRGAPGRVAAQLPLADLLLAGPQLIRMVLSGQ